MTNKYPGTCACGVYVEPGQGSAFKSGGGRWGVRCQSCGGGTASALPTQAASAAPASPARAFANRYPGTCACGRDVAVGAGVAMKNASGKWGVRCAVCATEAGQTPEPAAPQDTRRAIAADGAIAVPFSEDEGQKSLLRSLPPPEGARSAWNGDRRQWIASVSAADLRRTLEVARRLSLEIAPELLARESTEHTTEARAAASIPGLYHFQIEGVEFLASGKNRLLADDQGCIDGEAVVRMNRAGKGFSMKLSDLHRRFNGGSGYGKRWDLNIPTYIRSLCDGELRLNLVSKVLDKGIRPVVKLTLASGKTLRLTPDHEVAIGGGWVRADSLKPGDSVLSNGAAACKLCGSTERVSSYPYAKFVGVCRTCMYRKLREKTTYKTGKFSDKDGYVLVSGQWNHPKHDPHGSVREHVLVMERTLGRYLEPGERVHHIDENPANNAPENLQLLKSDSDHASLHGRSGGYRHMNGGRAGTGGLVQFVPVVDVVASVEPDGETRVYDVVCDDPHRNFVANGIIVHNCGKTIETLCALPREGELPPVLVILPNVVKHNWLNEATKWAPMYARTALEGRKGFRWPKPGEIVAINYDILPAEAEAPGRKTKDPEKALAAHTKFIAGSPRGLVVIVDEVHACRNASKRTRRVRGIVNAASRAWGLTGTPLLNHPDQLWRVMQSLDLAGTCFGSWNNFCRLFHATRNRWGGYEWGMPMPEVPERLRRAMLRRTKAEVLPDLPPKRYQVLEINGIGEALRAELDRLWEEWGEVVESEEALPPFERFSEIRQKLAAARTPAVLEWVEPYEDAGEPLVVFSAHRAPIDELGKREGWATITGDTPAEKRTEIVARFQAGELKGVACTIMAAGIGLTMTRACTALFVDLDWTPALNIQAQDRLHRIGQTAQSVLYVRMVSSHPLDLHIQNLISKKMEMIAASIERLVKVAPVEAAASPTGAVTRLEQEAAAIREVEQREARERCESITTRQRAKLGAEAPELKLTAKRVVAINEALAAMLGVCDGAMVKDGVGFNKPDAVRSRWLNVLGLGDEVAQRCALSMLQGYRRQLGERFPILWK